MQLLLTELVVGEWLQKGRDEGKTKRRNRMKREYTNLHCIEVVQISLLCTIDIHVLECAVLLCLVVCLTLPASFFFPSHLSLKHAYTIMYLY